MISHRLVYALLTTAMLLGASACVSAQESSADVNGRVNKAINLLLFGSEDPVALKHGWRGFFLDPGAVPVLDDALSSEEYDAEINSFDVTLHIEDGRATPDERSSLSTQWKKIVYAIKRQTRPSNRVDWLEVEADKVEQARSRHFNDSAHFSKYQQYEYQFYLLRDCEFSGSGVWRLTDLASYLTVRSALRCVADDWRLFGWKREIDAELAINRFMTSERRRLRKLVQSFELSDENTNDAVLATWFSPPRGRWADLDTWLHVEIPATEGQGRISFEIARIRLIRPWFDIDTVYREPLTIDQTKLDNPEPISDGIHDGALSFPGGAIGSFIEELVLIRKVQVPNANAHPLNFSHSDSIINRAGYIVRGLPELR